MQEFGFVAQDQSSTELHGLYARQKQQDDAVRLRVVSTEKIVSLLQSTRIMLQTLLVSIQATAPDDYGLFSDTRPATQATVGELTSSDDALDALLARCADALDNRLDQLRADDSIFAAVAWRGGQRQKSLVRVTLQNGKVIEVPSSTLLMDSGGKRPDGQIGTLDLAQETAFRAGSSAHPSNETMELRTSERTDFNWRIGARNGLLRWLCLTFLHWADVQQFDMNATEEKTAFQLINHDVKADAVILDKSMNATRRGKGARPGSSSSEGSDI